MGEAYWQKLPLEWYLIGLGLALKLNRIGTGLTWIGTGLTGIDHGLALDW